MANATIGTSSTARSTVNWPCVVARMLVATTALLLSFGALVTTYDAAMAVPDWPGTFGHNMFLYPLVEWFWGPWDLFLEHGHRLLGATAGMLSLLLAAVTFRKGASPAVRWLVVAAVVLVVVQGALGGLRVILDDKTVAKVHACTGPLFFAVATAIAVLSGRRGRGDTSAFATDRSDTVGQDPVVAVGRLSLPLPSWAVGASLPTALAVAAYLQLVAGAQLRHADATLAPSTFRWMVAIHLAGAAAVTVLAALAVIAWQPHESRVARRWSLASLAMVMGQLLLGGGAWLFTWGMPSWLQDAWAPTESVLARSPRGAAVITGHVILGMMILGAAVVLALEWGGADRLERIARFGRQSRGRPDGKEARLLPATVAVHPGSERGTR
jgi:cytochrome c oxidase assembly protein subunit 15